MFEEGALVFHPERVWLGRDVYVGHHAILKGYHAGDLRIGDGTWIKQARFEGYAGDGYLQAHDGSTTGLYRKTIVSRKTPTLIRISHFTTRVQRGRANCMGPPKPRPPGPLSSLA